YLDWNALVFPVWGIIIGRAAFHYRLLDLAPVARDALIERLGDSVFVLDDRARLVDANPEACRMMGWPQPPIGSQADEAFSSWTELAEACQAPEEPLPLKRDIQRGPDGAAHFYDLSLTPLKDRNNGVIGLLIVMHDITDLKRMEARLRELTLVDELTGLHNRRGFNVLAGQALQMADRMSLQAAVIFIDLDGLKTINDNYGHTEGDRALADAARLLRSTCRASDVLARFGGDEFIVLMMESREDGAQQLIDRFDEQFADFNARSRREYPLTISCGVARTSLDRPIPLEELINMADRAMYVNKRARRQAPAEI
ncbi:MAG TPA: GGDEF domain-containing protein, partial [Chloroflexi bacterium]|nr:GGDEF domain-containing protein [Chloroflexota bacterium]